MKYSNCEIKLIYSDNCFVVHYVDKGKYISKFCMCIILNLGIISYRN